MGIRVVVADDQALVRHAFGMLVASAGDMAMVGEAATGHEAVLLARRERADVIVLDVHLPDMDGIAVSRHLAMDPVLPRTRTLLLTVFDDDNLVVAALRAGTHGFLRKTAGPAELLAAIRTVAAGDPVLSPAATKLIIQGFLRAASG